MPHQVVSHFHLRQGDRVADFGAGSGHFTYAMAHAVHPGGRVFAVEIQKSLAERITKEAHTKKLSNIEIIWGDLEGANGVRIADSSLDAALLANTLFQITDKARALKEIARTLHIGGKLIIIEWSESYGGMGPQRDHVVLESEAKAYAERAGFSYERSIPAGAHHYGCVFRKQ